MYQQNKKTRKSDKKRRLRPIAKAATAHYFEILGQKRRLRPIAKAATAHCFEHLGHPEKVEKIKILLFFLMPPQVLREVSMSQRHHIRNL